MQANPTPTDRGHGTWFMVDLPDPVDLVAIERRARELRAQAFADAMRTLFAFVLRRGAASRAPVAQGHAA